MPRRLLPLLLLPVLLTGACSDTRDAVLNAPDCAALAADVARSGLASTPTRAEAEAAVERLDERVSQLDSPAVRDAATELRDRLQELQAAARAGDAPAVQAAAEQAREAARAAAEACSVPVEQFLGG